MPSPFPGMNPYLENPQLWSEVHHRLITAIANSIKFTIELHLIWRSTTLLTQYHLSNQEIKFGQMNCLKKNDCVNFNNNYSLVDHLLAFLYQKPRCNNE
ncbi:MAG: DUF4058 family protein [Phormidium sp.]